MKGIVYLSIFFVFISQSFAQRGKDGNPVISSTQIVNDYTSVTANASIGDTIITVTNSTLNNNFSSNLSQGDLILIYQPQGATLDNNNPLNSSSWGAVVNYNEAGNYEFVQVKSIPNSTSIVLDCPLQNSYTSFGDAFVIRVPRYASLTINNGGSITCPAWNGITGGIVAIEVEGTTTINAGGNIDVSGLGFRGGRIENNSTFGGLRYADNDPVEGAEKGESIGGDQAFYGFFLAGPYCRAAAANGGGGGNAHNAGGGGGANAGNIANWNTGTGVPDPTFNAQWALETPSIAGVVSSGGGRGGYSHCSTAQDPNFIAPGDAAWTGDFRRQVGGLGGRPLDYSTGKIFMGGAGGAGDGNSSFSGAGGNGAGIVFLSTYGNVNGSGNINANGQDGFNSEGSNPFATTGNDGAGGAGAGGTVLIQTTGTVTGITVSADGGNGGNQILATPGADGEAEGPGGGGGGGYIAISAGSATTTANGGSNGTSTSTVVGGPNAPNGATGGGVGMPNETVDAFDIAVIADTICENNTASLSASLTGNPPGGTQIEWYDAEFGGSLLFTGSNFTTPILSSTTTYWVKVCPAPYLVPVTAIVNICSAPPVASFSATDSSICVNECVDFTDLSTNSPTSWNWYFFGSDSTNSSQQNPTNICYSSAGSFDVALVVDNGTGTDSLFVANFITVNALPTVTASNDTSICIGDTANISVSGTATSYSWDNSLGIGTNFAVNPVVNTTYIVTGTDANNCSNVDSVIVSINALPTVTASNDTSICIGDTANISVSGTATSYSWDNSLGIGTNFAVNPVVNTTYIVTGMDANNCSNVDSVIVSINALPTVTASNDTSICIGDTANISVSGTATSYSWDNGLGIGTNFAVNPVVNTTYIVTGMDANNCSNVDSVVVSINALPTITASNDTSICIGDTANISVSGTATSYSWDNGLGIGTNFAVNPVVNTTYIVTGMDANNCSNVDSVVVTIDTLPNIIASLDTSVCIGSPANITATGGVSYTWDNGLGAGQNQSPTPLVNTTYIVTGLGANGCSDTSAVTVTVDPLPNVTANADSTSICSGSNVTLTGGGATSYTWDNSVIDGVAFAPSATTLYTVTGTDANGCTNTDTITVTVNACGTPPTASFSASDSTICLNDCIDFTDLSAGAPNSWSWYFFGADSTNSTQQNPTNICYSSAGSFDVALVVDNGNGTDSLFLANFITVNNLPIVTANADSTSICTGSNVTLTGGGATSYTWDNSVIDGVAFAPSATTLYTVTGTDANGCTNTDTITVTVNACGTPPTASFSASDSTICLNDCIDFTDLSAGAPNSWSWYFFGADSTNSNQQNPTNICYSSAGSFDVALVVDNGNGTDSLFMANFITINNLPVVTANATSTSICSGSNVTLTGGGAVSYIWDNSVTDGVPFAPSATTLYTVTGTDANGCTNTDTITVNVNICSSPIAGIGSSSNSICINDCVDFTDLSTGGTPTNWTWYFEGATPNISNQQNPTNICYDTTGSYGVSLMVSNAFGQDSIYMSNYIVVDSCTVIEEELTIPNVFSPNGDGENDLFKISGTNINTLYMEIYNRWGEILYQTDLINSGWDGRTNAGDECSDGTYFYLAEVNGEIYKGTLTLIR